MARAWMSHLLVGVGLLLAGPARAQGGPVVVVRADTRIELRVERRADGSAHLLGTLRDDLGTTLAGVPLDVAVWRDEGEAGRWSAHPRTDATGTFDVVLSSEEGWWASATFAGDELYLPTEARQRLDLSLAHVSLTVHVEDRGILDLDRPSHTVRVGTTSSAGGAGLDVSLRNELGVVLAEGRTDPNGEVVLDVPSERLGPPSAGRLVALSRADALRSAAQAEVPIVRLRPTALTLERIGEGDERATLSGTLRDSAGPRAREAVGIYAGGGRYLGTAATDESGRFTFEVPAEAVAGLGSEVPLVARFTSDAPWIGASESPPVRWSLRPPLLDAATAAGLVSLLLVLGALVALSRRPARERERVTDPGQGSLVLGERGRARVVTVSGRVEDARTGRPLAAQVEIGGQEHATDEGGAFTVEPPPGRHVLTVRAPEHGAFTASIVVPHRGEHTQMRVRLVSRRDLALSPLRPIALRLLPSSELWSLWTQRELLVALRKAGREPPELAVLIERVEQACYGDAPPDEAEIAAIRALAARVEGRLPAPREGAR